MQVLERQLQREVKEKAEELDRLKSMIKDKKLENEQRSDDYFPSNQSQSNTEHYEKLNKEIDSVKVMLLDLRANQLNIELPSP